jgi:1,4-dihydroxy-2-naphthoyl-CoA synthase
LTIRFFVKCGLVEATSNIGMVRRIVEHDEVDELAISWVTAWAGSCTAKD